MSNKEQDTRKAAMIYRIYSMARSLGLDELLIIQMVTERLEFGQRKYGKFVLSSSPKDWIKEFQEEQLDAVVYSACAAMTAKSATDAAVAGKLLEIALQGTQASIPDAVTKAPAKPSLTDRIYFAVLGREVPILVTIFLIIVLGVTGYHLAFG